MMRDSLHREVAKYLVDMSSYVLLNLNNVCRFCLELKENLSPIFKDDEKDNLSTKASYITSIEIEDDEYLPRHACEQCQDKINDFYDFKYIIIQSQNTLREKTAIIVESTFENIENEPFTKLIDTSGIEIIKETSEINCCQLTIDDVPENTKTTVLNDLKQCLESGPLHLNKEEDKEFDTKHHTPYPSMLTAIKNNLCLLCLQQCSDTLSLQKHVYGHIAGTLLEPYYLVNEKHIVCGACDKKFNYRFTFLEHQRQHLNIKPFVCEHDDCNLSFYSNSTLKQHLSLHANKDYVCSTCGHGFKRKSDLRCHEIIHKDDGKIYTCSECFKQFKNRITLKAHAKIHYVRPKHKCTRCAKEYYSPSELSRHMFRHAEKKMFICNTCNRAYFSKSSLNRHQRELCNVHGNLTNVTKIVKSVELDPCKEENF